MANIIIKKYQHYNRAMGKHIRSREHYEREMIAGGYVPFDKACQMADDTKKRNTKKYDGLSDKTMKFMNEVKQTAGRDGKIDVSDRYVQGLREHGVRLDMSGPLPTGTKGGFKND